MAIAGAIGTAKTSCCMYPFADQILAYRASDRDKQVGGLVPEVKGDFFHKVQQILDRHGEGQDYIETGLGAEYRYKPLHNGLDALAGRDRSGSRGTQTSSNSSPFYKREQLKAVKRWFYNDWQRSHRRGNFGTSVLVRLQPWS
jgi:hypothetical protein